MSVLADHRFDVPLYTTGEAARIVGVPASTFSQWARGSTRREPGRPDSISKPVLTYMQPDTKRDPSIPFIGLAEGLVLAAIRKSGVSMQKVRPALERLKTQMGIDYALASERLYTDGAELLYDYAEEMGKPDLVVIRDGQRVFPEVIQEYLRRIEYCPDGYASLIKVPAYRHAQVVADPYRSFGAPIFERGGARVSDVLELFWAGESLEGVCDEFGVPAHHFEDVLRASSLRAA